MVSNNTISQNGGNSSNLAGTPGSTLGGGTSGSRNRRRGVTPFHRRSPVNEDIASVMMLDNDMMSYPPRFSMANSMQHMVAPQTPTNTPYQYKGSSGGGGTPLNSGYYPPSVGSPPPSVGPGPSPATVHTPVSQPPSVPQAGKLHTVFLSIANN